MKQERTNFEKAVLAYKNHMKRVHGLTDEQIDTPSNASDEDEKYVYLHCAKGDLARYEIATGKILAPE